MEVNFSRHWIESDFHDINPYQLEDKIKLQVPEDSENFMRLYPSLLSMESNGVISCTVNDIIPCMMAYEMLCYGEDGPEWAKLIMIGDKQHAHLFKFEPEFCPFDTNTGMLQLKYDDIVLIDHNQYADLPLKYMKDESKDVLYERSLSKSFFMGYFPVSAFVLWKVLMVRGVAINVCLWPSFRLCKISAKKIG